MPSYWGNNALAEVPSCIGCWDFKSSGDQSGNGHSLTGAYSLASDGLVLPGGASGLGTGLIPPSGNSSVVMAAKVASDNAADGMFISGITDPANGGVYAGFSVKYTQATNQVQLQVMQASGAVASSLTDGNTSVPLNTWFIVAFRTYTNTPGNYVAPIYYNNGHDSIVSVYFAAPHLTPAQPIKLGDGYLATKGVKGRLGMLAVYSDLKPQADLQALIVTARAEMQSKHGITVA
jgi:hypothetical protein